MLERRMPAAPQRCPRCAGLLYRDYDGDYGCVFCGECISVSAPPERWGAPVAASDPPRHPEAAPIRACA